MSSSPPLWSEGVPNALAVSFINHTEDKGRLLGRRYYLHLVAAIASASVHNALTHRTATRRQFLARVENILLTAQTVERLIAAAVPAEDDDEFEGSSNNGDDDDGVARLQNIEAPLNRLEEVVLELRLEDPSGHLLALDEPPGSNPAGSPAASGSRGDTGTARLPSGILDLTEAALGPIFAFLDARTAATAAATCKRLCSAHRRLRYFDLSPAFCCYLLALLGLQDDFSDGSLESEFAANFPLDGSPACGSDLAEESYSRRMAAAIPDVEQLFALLGRPGGRSVEDFRSSIERVERRRIAPPHAQSSPLAFFKSSQPVAFTCSAFDDHLPGQQLQSHQQLLREGRQHQQQQRQRQQQQQQEQHHHHQQQQQQQQQQRQQQQQAGQHPQVPQQQSADPWWYQPWRLQPHDPHMHSESSSQPPQPAQHRGGPGPDSEQRQQQLLPQLPMRQSAEDGAAVAPLTPPETRPVTPWASKASISVVAATSTSSPDQGPLAPGAPLGGAPHPTGDDGGGGRGRGDDREGDPVPTAGVQRGGDVCCLANAICDVQEVWDVPTGRLHCDGDLLAMASVPAPRDAGAGDGGDAPGPVAAQRRAGLWQSRRGRTRALCAVALHRGSAHPQYDRIACYGHVIEWGARQLQRQRELQHEAPPSMVARLCADSGNGLVWAGVDDSAGHVYGFAAPVEPSWAAAGGPAGRHCGDAEAEQHQQQHHHHNHQRHHHYHHHHHYQLYERQQPAQCVLASGVRGLEGSHAGLHVLGRRLICVKGSGALLSWDITRLPLWRDDYSGGGEAADGGGEYEDEDLDARPYQRRRQETCAYPSAGGGYPAAAGRQERAATYSRAVQPHDISVLPLPSPFGRPSAAGLLISLSRSLEEGAMAGGGGPYEPVRQTQLLYDPAAPSPPTLVAAMAGNIVVTYDLETARAKQCLFGHLYDIMDIAPPPPAWRQASVFATCSKSGDVKLWDVRTACSSAAVTLTCGEIWQMNAVVLASASPGGWAGGSQLGAGMMCFAGGEGESIWAWDLRGGHARAAYELSTGNSQVMSLAWHEAGNSLWASCETRWRTPLGGYNRRDWKTVRVNDSAAAAAGPAARPADGDSGGGSGGSCSLGGSGTAGSSSAGGMANGAGGSSTLSQSMETSAGRGDDEGGGGGGGGGGGAGERVRFWPTRAKHQPDDFGAFFNMSRACVLRYRFGSEARGEIPASSGPGF